MSQGTGSEQEVKISQCHLPVLLLGWASCLGRGLSHVQLRRTVQRAIFHILHTVSPKTERLPSPRKHKLKIKVNFRALGEKNCAA